MPDIFVGCFTYAVSRNPQNKMFLQIKRVRSERLSDLPKATQLVSGRVRIRTRSIGQYKKKKKKKKPLWTLVSKEDPSILMGICIKGLKGYQGKEMEASEGPVGLCV